MSVNTIIAPNDLRAQIKQWRLQNKKIALVPTMGALHQGHISLVEAAQQAADYVVVSIFVNPLQFGPKEDFASYPRMLAADLEKLELAKADILFAPIAADMYPEGFQTFVHNNALSEVLEGQSRPGHFNGMLTIVLKLLNLVQPDVAFFGKKDYQQLKLIQIMVRDLCLPIEIVGQPTIREASGLAMSSRNLRLTPEELAKAPQIYKALSAVATAHEAGEKDYPKLISLFKAELSKVDGFRLDTIDIRTQDRMGAFEGLVDKPAVASVAAHLGSVRLIDNLEFSGS
ncbi:MAG: pantoate--beta-alanine ligase [Chitinophagaceae bacterium]|nr:pantoate--beta-alanine ligase [Oligoflexus sp.]